MRASIAQWGSVNTVTIERKPEAMTHHITAYEGTDRLTDFHGKTILELSSSRISIVETYRIESWGKSHAMVYKLPNNRGWIVGYSLGEGCLFRGEYLEKSKYFEDDSDARRFAKDVAEYWIERDQEDQEEFDREQAEEMDCIGNAEELADYEI